MRYRADIGIGLYARWYVFVFIFTGCALWRICFTRYHYVDSTSSNERRKGLTGQLVDMRYKYTIFVIPINFFVCLFARRCRIVAAVLFFLLLAIIHWCANKTKWNSRSVQTYPRPAPPRPCSLSLSPSLSVCNVCLCLCMCIQARSAKRGSISSDYQFRFDLRFCIWWWCLSPCVCVCLCAPACLYVKAGCGCCDRYTNKNILFVTSTTMAANTEQNKRK